MQRTAQKSQQKSVSGYPRIYALAEKGVNAAYVRVAFWAVGVGNFNASFRLTFPRAEIPAKIAEIDAALAEGSGIFDAGDGKVYEISPELLGELRSILSSYHAVQGGSDAHVVRGGVSTPRKPKASARADGGRVPEASSPSEVAGSVGRQLSNDEIARIVGEELRKAVMPVLAEIDAITALVKECAAELAAVSKQFITRASGEFGGRNTPPAPRRKGGRDNSCCPKAGRVNAEGSISTRHGRTSVVVGRRKVS